jgi:hypothetical protein
MAAPKSTLNSAVTRQVTVMFEPTRLAPTYLIQVYALLLPDAPAGLAPTRSDDHVTAPSAALPRQPHLAQEVPHE